MIYFTSPRLGLRVRFTGRHDRVPVGTVGMIDQISGDRFVVLLDEGAWFFWTSFDKWEPTGEPDVELSAEYKTARACVRNVHTSLDERLVSP